MSNPAPEPALPIATLSIYLLLIPPIIFCAWKHGLLGCLGWGYLLLFCGLKITSSAIQIPAELLQPSPDRFSIVALLNNVALSPLLLASAGLLHESRTTRDPGMRRRLEWLKVGAYHAFVLVSILLVIVGWAKEDNMVAVEDWGYMKIGIAGILICGCMLASWMFASFDLGVEENHMEAPAFVDGTRLLYSLLATVPLLFIRGIYAALSIFMPPSKFQTSVIAKVLMVVVVEMLIVCILVGTGILTRKVGRRRRGGEGGHLEREVQDIYPQTDEGTVWEPKF